MSGDPAGGIAIGDVRDPRGILVRLPPRFWLLLSLRRAFPGMVAEPDAWTYRLPVTAGAAQRVELWLAGIEARIAADARKRAWAAIDAEWSGSEATACA